MMLSRAFFVDAMQNLTEAEEAGTLSKYTRSELEPIEDLLKDNEAWMTEKMHEQDAADKELYNDPAVTISELEARGKTLQYLVRTFNRFLCYGILIVDLNNRLSPCKKRKCLDLPNLRRLPKHPHRLKQRSHQGRRRQSLKRPRASWTNQRQRALRKRLQRRCTRSFRKQCIQHHYHA